MHADDAIGDAAQQRDRVVAGDDGVGRVVLHAEVRAVGMASSELEEDVLLLRELGVLPEAVLVVVLQAEHDVVLARDGQDLLDALDDPVEPLLAGSTSGIALAGEHAADRAGTAQAPR